MHGGRCLKCTPKLTLTNSATAKMSSTAAVHAVSDTNGTCEPARGRPDHPAELLGDDHAGTSAETPLRPDAFVLSDEEKIAAIEPLFGQVPCLHPAAYGAARRLYRPPSRAAPPLHPAA